MAAVKGEDGVEEEGVEEDGDDEGGDDGAEEGRGSFRHGMMLGKGSVKWSAWAEVVPSSVRIWAPSSSGLAQQAA